MDTNIENVQIVAFYLPQFHPFKENDEWWGKGFTEWTNVGKAKCLYSGHYQPKVPADLGYYDLRIPDVRQKQASLAREAGISAFCYWHYWFGNGKQLMNSIIDDVLDSGAPDFPFCFGWANESWKSKLWNKDGIGDKLLMEQTYPGEADYKAHFDYVKQFFKDPRYYRVDGRPFFYIYKPEQFPDISNFISLWNKWIKEEGIAQGIYFIANIPTEESYKIMKEKGFSAVSPSILTRINYYPRLTGIKKIIRKLKKSFLKTPIINYYDESLKYVWNTLFDSKEDVIPGLMPNWDHTPRSGEKGMVLEGACPALFEKQIEIVLNGVKSKNNKLVLLKSWNEWGEGNYMEPDLKWGKGFLFALKKHIF